MVLFWIGANHMRLTTHALRSVHTVSYMYIYCVETVLSNRVANGYDLRSLTYSGALPYRLSGISNKSSPRGKGAILYITVLSDEDTGFIAFSA